MVLARGNYDYLHGKAHTVFELTPGSSLNIAAMIQGLKLYDPRTGLTTYSTNPALALGRVFTDSGYTVDWTSFGTAATYCDTLVGGEKRWEIGLHIDNRQTLRSWVHALAQYAGVFIDIQGGVVYLVSDKVKSVDHTVGAHQIVAGSLRMTKAGSRNSPRRVLVHYREPEGAEKTAETATSADPGTTARLQMPGFQTYTRAKRYATQVYNKAQNDLQLEFVSFDDGLKHTIGDLGSITHSAFGLSSKQMMLVDYRQVDRGRWRRSYVEYDSANYSNALFTESTTGDTNLPNPNEPPNGPTPTLVEELYTDQTGVTYSRIKITFTGAAWPYVRSYRVTANGAQNVLEATLTHTGSGTHTVYTAALKQGIAYQVDVYVVSNTGVLSEVAGTATLTALGKLLPPGSVPSLTAYEAGTLVAMEWGAAEEITGDLKGYIIKRLPAADYLGTSADWTHTNAITIASRVDATSYLTAAQPSGAYYYGIKAVDTAGNFSLSATWRYVNVTQDSGSTNTVSLGAGVTQNMHAYRIDGDADYVITSTGATFTSLYAGGAAWTTYYTASERWGGNIQTDSSFETEVWDVGTIKQGNWNWADTNVTMFGGTQANRTIVGDNSSPISYTTHIGNAIQSAGQNFKAKVFTSDSPASAGDGMLIRLPIDASFSGAILEQSATVTIAETSPLDNPKAVTFPTAYTDPPRVTLTAFGTAAVLPVVDNLTRTGFDLYLFTTAGLKTSGSVAWAAKGT
jgi:hypothetical protein